MGEIRIGDKVTRSSYGQDVIFVVLKIIKARMKIPRALLRGLNKRLMADSPVNDLVPAHNDEVESLFQSVHKETKERMERVFLRRVSGDLIIDQRRHSDKILPPGIDYQRFPGKVLHLDGDGDYLKHCLEYYQELGVPAVGYHVYERVQATRVVPLLKEHLPDILVMTGHDGFITRAGNK